MRKQLLSGLVALGVVAFGCSDKMETNDKPDDGPKGYVTLELIGSMNTRTSSVDESTDSGNQDESAIISVHVVFTNEFGLISVIETPSFTDGVSSTFEIATGEYYVHALVNKPQNVDLGVNQNIRRVIETLSAADATGGLGKDGFFMVNTCNSSTAQAGVHVKVASDNTKSKPAEVEIYVDRAAAKIEDKTAAFSIDGLSKYSGFFDALEPVGIVPLNVNKEYNMIQTWGKDNGDRGDLNSEVLSTPLQSTSAMARNHVADQYHHNIGEYTRVKWENNKLISAEDLTNAAAFTKNAVYTTENRPTILFFEGGLTAGRGETTGVIYRMQAKKGGIDAPTFYVVNGKAYNDIASLPKLTPPGVDMPTDIPSLRGLGVKAYENGVIYYTHFITDPNKNHRYEGKNYLGVFRNSIYSLDIQSISSLGDDVPGGTDVNPDPSQGGGDENPPISEDKTYMNVTVTVNPWILHTINIDF